MAIQKTCITTLFLLSCVFSSNPTTSGSGKDTIAMSKLASALQPLPHGWSKTIKSYSYCNWHGVSCDTNKYVLVIDIRNHGLSGILPPELSSIDRLQSLLLSNNFLHGPLPSLANLSSLTRLYLDKNNFTSIPPLFFQGLYSLEYLHLRENPHLVPWSFPIELNQSTSLIALDASQSNMTGSLPDIFDSFPALESLKLSGNNLTGSLPASLGNSSLTILQLNNQKIGFSGTIDVLSRMPSLTVVWLHDNNLTGPIPDLQGCENLNDLQLHTNLLTGIVPASLVQLPKLSKISLRNNRLQGPFPHFPDNIKADSNGTNNFCTKPWDPCDAQVTTLLKIMSALGYPLLISEYWKGNNACDHWRFVTCNSKEMVMTVNLSNQNFTGMISPAFANLTALVELYLNDNNLKGPIPNSLTKLPWLQVLDVSNNNLSGETPKFASSVKLITTGNPYLIPRPPAKTSHVRMRDTIIAISVVTIIVISITAWKIIAKYRGFVSSWKEKDGAMLSFDAGESYSISMLVQGKRNQIKLKELSLVALEKLRAATNEFHPDNKLGQGGFGSVYWGKFLNGQEIAVKRLSKTSGQGQGEFMNEAFLISKLQHRNLVKLLCCCVEEGEKMLVYEYMPNKSLDAFIFDPLKQHILDWRKRLNIIDGIARGILYLHRDSRLKIIHRDLKASNILLDEWLNPKISDFGMAKIFDGTEDQANTRRVVGTYGYMAPEYAMEGRFSEKSDVFSFGVLLLEIVSGRRNNSFHNNEQALSLLTYAWKLWNEDNIMEMIDPLISEPCFEMEILRCIQVGLLCVQEFPKDRPNISQAISMLSYEICELPIPKQPGFTNRQSAESPEQGQHPFSINNVTMTSIQGR